MISVWYKKVIYLDHFSPPFVTMTIFTSTLPSIPPFKEGIVQTLFRQRDANDDFDRPCYIDALTGKTLTFAQVRDMSLRFGAGLQDVLGFQEGDVLAVIAPNVVRKFNHPFSLLRALFFIGRS